MLHPSPEAPEGDGGETATVQVGRIVIRRRLTAVNRAQARFWARRRFGAFRVENSGLVENPDLREAHVGSYMCIPILTSKA